MHTRNRHRAAKLGAPTTRVPGTAMNHDHDHDHDQGKAQWVRIADVVLVGPVMVWGGLRLRGPLGWTLAALGVATVLYNSRNYMRLWEPGRDPG